MRSDLLTYLIVLASFIFASCLAQNSFAQSQHTPVTKSWDLEKPLLPKNSIAFGGDIRIRYERIDKAFDLGLDDSPLSDYLRIRPSLSFSYGISNNTQICARLTNESRIYLSDCEGCKSQIDEFVFDNLFIESRNPMGLPIYVRIGRQDIFYGNGLLICDGGPLDGSRTTYVNGVVLTSRIPLWGFDFFTLYNPRRDRFLPRINNKYTKMIENDEFVVGIVLRRIGENGRAMPSEIEPYLIYKQESGNAKAANVSTIGLRLGLAGERSTSAGFEFAYQFGNPVDIILPENTRIASPDTNAVSYISAFGLTADITQCFKTPMEWSLTVGYINLSGDDRQTVGKFEGWNPLLARWPKWSELLIRTSCLEKDLQGMGQGVAYWQNLRSPFIGITLNPMENLRFDASYMWLDAANSIFFSPEIGGHTHRGELVTAVLTVRTKMGTNGHIRLEKFYPGDFYPQDSEPATYFRVEISTLLR